MVLSDVKNIKQYVANVGKMFGRFFNVINLSDLRSGTYEYCFTLRKVETMLV